MGFAPTTSKDKDTGKKIFTFSLRLPELIGLNVIILVGFVWVFIFGLLVGRGYQPEEAVPELKHIMPSQQVAKAPPVPVEQNIGAKNSTQSSKKTSAALPQSTQQPTSVAEKKGSVIEPEQLNFFEQLKAKEASNSPATAPKPKTAHVAAKRPAPTPVVAEQVVPMPKKVATANQPAQKKEAALEKNTATFEYIYQVAASTNKEAATKLRNTISAKGFTTSLATAVIKTTKWYRVNVHFIGTPEDLSTFKSRLAGAGYNKPLLRKKKQR
ncbi:SPOR domain-containing protein [Halodesulfovibrio marinisediminis]|uniref:Cell division protein FtsN n=1 Tax=Halodesulfovibrio marinisediminis DSM 17456 TaxID=1121457 RepID=A0A1N6DDZ5_9BACT|nr:SPOR domain-containing protein [Halodesulfovibrio marinisediminis]SIN69049.1 Cell division protein FtsN [Halodesulfovibrio marinisediminis DSM 17456]